MTVTELRVPHGDTVECMRAWLDTYGSPNNEARMRQLWADPPADWRSDLLDRHRVMLVLAYIQRHPEQWNQHVYTAAVRGQGCIAGLTVALELEVSIGLLRPAMAARGQCHWDTPHLARQLLGLSVAQAACLFNYTWVPSPQSPLLGGCEVSFDEMVDRVALVTGVDFHARKPSLPAQEALSVSALPPVPVVPGLVGAAA